MKPEEVSIEEQAAAFKDWLQLAGKTIIQRFSEERGEWITLTRDSLLKATDIIRRKPEPKLRPWKPEEVPWGAAFHKKKEAIGRYFFIIETYMSGDCFYVIFHGNDQRHTLELRDNWEHSLDNGKTWLPCGVLESNIN